MTIVIIALWLLCFLWLIWKLATAPEGWEDDDGFHLGKR